MVVRRQRELLRREEELRELQRRSGQPVDERSAAQVASEAFAVEARTLRASGRDHLTLAASRGELPDVINGVPVRGVLDAPSAEDRSGDDDDDDGAGVFRPATDSAASAADDDVEAGVV